MSLKPNPTKSVAESSSLTPSRNILVATIALGNATEFIAFGDWRRPLFAVLLLLSMMTRAWAALGCTLVFFALYFYALVVPQSIHALPVLGFLLPFIFSSLILLSLTPTRDYFRWLSRGKIDKTSKILIVVIGAVSTAALILWALWTNNLGYGGQFVAAFGPTPKWMVFTIFIPLFAFANAFAEEVIYRGLIQESLSRAFSNIYVVIFLQGTVFAAAHLSGGFPNGLMGYVMTLAYGMMLGYLRVRTKGILASYIAHVIADTTIACLLVYLVTYSK